MVKRLEIRLPDELHAALVREIDWSKRSLNAEMVWRLEQSLWPTPEGEGPHDNQATEYRELRRRGLARTAADEGR
jgi:hypothetical protein